MKQRIPKGAILKPTKTGAPWRVRWKGCDGGAQRRMPTESGAIALRERVLFLREQGEDLEAAIRTALREPEPSRGVTFADMVDRYLNSLQGVRTPENLSREDYRGAAAKSGELAELEPKDIYRATAARWRAQLGRERPDKRRRGATTCNRIQSFASKAWRWAQSNGYAPDDRNPFMQVERTPETPGEVDPLTGDEARAVIDRMDAQMQPYALAALMTGWRPGELAKLTWSDVDLDEGRIRLSAARDKRRRGKGVAMASELRQALKALHGHGRAPRALVFTRDGRPWTSRARVAWFRRALKRAIADKKVCARHAGQTFYGLKDCAITTMLSRGMSPALASRVSGVDIGTIMKHYTGWMLDAQAEALDAVWGDNWGDSAAVIT